MLVHSKLQATPGAVIPALRLYKWHSRTSNQHPRRSQSRRVSFQVPPSRTSRAGLTISSHHSRDRYPYIPENGERNADHLSPNRIESRGRECRCYLCCPWCWLVTDPNPPLSPQINNLANLAQDTIFIGPNDLALSLLGYVPAKGDEPEYVNAIEKIVAAARKHGKWVARLSNDGALSKEHLKVFDTVAMSYDVRALQNWYTNELKVARS
jgi:hypothetical protein